MADTKKPKKSTNTRRSFLPGLEMLILLVFLGSFLMIAVPKCKQKQLEYGANDSEMAENATVSDTVATTPASTAVPTVTVPPTPAATTSAAPSTATSTTNTIERQATRLFVTIDELNMRTGPSLDSSIVAKLALYQEVLFLNEITPFTQQIALSAEDVADEPWIKVQTLTGKRGWVYGAGVYYYKRERKLENN